MSLVNGGIGIVAFALNCPVVARVGASHKVDAEVGASKVLSPWEFFPKPYFFQIVVTGVGEKPEFHQSLEILSFLSFAE